MHILNIQSKCHANTLTWRAATEIVQFARYCPIETGETTSYAGNGFHKITSVHRKSNQGVSVAFDEVRDLPELLSYTNHCHIRDETCCHVVEPKLRPQPDSVVCQTLSCTFLQHLARCLLFSRAMEWPWHNEAMQYFYLPFLVAKTSTRTNSRIGVCCSKTCCTCKLFHCFLSTVREQIL